MATHLPHRLLQIPQIHHRQSLQEAGDHEDHGRQLRLLQRPQEVVQDQEDRPRRVLLEGIQPRSVHVQVQIGRRCCHRSVHGFRIPQQPFRGETGRQNPVCSDQISAEDEPQGFGR